MLDTLASLEKGDRILFVSWNDERYGWQDPQVIFHNDPEQKIISYHSDHWSSIYSREYDKIQKFVVISRTFSWKKWRAGLFK
jgi:hypothetical protein